MDEYPIGAGTVLVYLGRGNDGLATDRGTFESIDWIAGVPLTVAEVQTALDSPEYATWLAENGGDPVLTNRRKARERIDAECSMSTAHRAEMSERNKRDNYIVTRLLELQAALDAIKASTGPVASIRNAIPASWSPTATRPRADARQDLRDAINAGDGDN